MELINFFVNIQKSKRFCQIIGIILRQAIREWWYQTRWGKRQVVKKPQLKVHSTQERIRMVIEELGPTYIKFGQILADRPDVISEKLRSELKKLQSSAIPMSDIEAVKLIENELGRPLSDIFESFDQHCLASASIGQVYTGQLVTGQEVVVKIQRPYIEDKIKLDIFLMRKLAHWLARNYPEMAAMNVIGLVREFGDGMLKELDYTIEQSNMLVFHKMFEGSSTVYIPQIYTEYTTKRLLVQERLFGISPDKVDELRLKGYDTNQIATNGADALLKMILERGFFHADPHAGNLFILPGNVIGFIDFGMVGVLRPRDLNFLASFTIAFMRRDTRAIGESLITLCGLKFFSDMEDLEFDLSILLRQYEGIPIEKIDFASVIEACIALIVKYKMHIPSGIYMLAKSLATIQKVAEALSPDIAIIPILEPYARNIVTRKIDPTTIATGLYHILSDYGSLLKNFPSDINEILYQLKKGEIRHKIDLTTNRVIHKIGNKMALAVLLIGTFLGSIMLINAEADTFFSHILIYISPVFIVILFFKWLFDKY